MLIQQKSPRCFFKGVLSSVALSPQVQLICNVSTFVESLDPQQLQHFENFPDEPAYVGMPDFLNRNGEGLWSSGIYDGRELSLE